MSDSISAACGPWHSLKVAALLLLRCVSCAPPLPSPLCNDFLNLLLLFAKVFCVAFSFYFYWFNKWTVHRSRWLLLLVVAVAVCACRALCVCVCARVAQCMCASHTHTNSHAYTPTLGSTNTNSLWQHRQCRVQFEKKTKTKKTEKKLKEGPHQNKKCIEILIKLAHVLFFSSLFFALVAIATCLP